MRLNSKDFLIYVVALCIAISSKVFAVELSDVESKSLAQTIFSGRDWARMPPNIQAKFQVSKNFKQRYPEEHLVGFWTNRKTRANLLITEKANKTSTPVLNLSSMSTEDVKKHDEELHQNLLLHFKSQMPSEYQGKLNLHFAKSIYLKAGNYCYQQYHSAPGRTGETIYSTDLVCKDSDKYLRLKLNQIMKPLSNAQFSELQSLAKYYLGG